jgi:hypothetical protein
MIFFVFPIIGIELGIKSFCNKLVKLARGNYCFGIMMNAGFGFIMGTQAISEKAYTQISTFAN